MSKVIAFPTKFPHPDSLDESKFYRIPLYSEADVELVLLCLNAFGDSDARYVRDDLPKTDPVYVAKCLDIAHRSELLAVPTRSHVKAIRDSVQEVNFPE